MVVDRRFSPPAWGRDRCRAQGVSKHNLTTAQRRGDGAEAIIAASTSSPLELDLLPECFAIARFDPQADLPAWVQFSTFVSVTRTPQELSVVCHESVLPSTLEARRGFRCFGVRGPLDFSEIGILASLTRALAETGISIFALSTYDTDYLLVTDECLDDAVRALTEAGHTIHGLGVDDS